MVNQVLVKGLHGKSLCLKFETNILYGSHLKSCLASRLGISASQQRLVTGTQEVHDGFLLKADVDGFFPSCFLLAYVLGGKGGFGSLLRGAASKAGQKKTENFDACRDMSGRRMRHVNAEKKLKEWKYEARERELEKMGEAYIKKIAREKKIDSTTVADLHKLREESAEAMENVAHAVVDGMRQSRMAGKRKVLEIDDYRKKGKLMGMLQDLDEEDESEADEDDDEDDDDDGILHIPQARVLHESPTSKEDEAGPSSGITEERSEENLGLSDENAGNSEEIIKPSENKEAKFCVSANTSCTEDGHAAPGVQSLSPASPVEEDKDRLSDVPSSQAMKSNLESLREQSKDTSMLISNESENTGIQHSLNLENYDSATQLEALGLERLKEELKQAGLKCGGRLAERAERLFLLKHHTIDKIDEKHLAKPSINS